MDEYSRGLHAGMAAAFELAADFARDGHPYSVEEFEAMAARQRRAAGGESPDESGSRVCGGAEQGTLTL